MNASSDVKSFSDVTVEARILGHQTGVFSMFKQAELADLIRYYSKDGATFEQTRERMCDAWHEYQKAMPLLRCPSRTALTFFQSPTWENPKLWPWADPPRTEPGWNQEQTKMTLEETNAVRARIGMKPLEAL